MDTVLTKDEELVKAEAEAWHKTHYRAEWFVSRTLGYAVILGSLAIYIFWDATRWTPSENAMRVASAVWIAAVAIALMIYDHKVRLAGETWKDVFRRIHKHLALSVGTFLVSIGIAFGIHSAAFAFAQMTQPLPSPTTGTTAQTLIPPIPTVTLTKTKSKPKVAKKPKPAAKPAPPTAKPAAKKPVVTKKPAATKTPKPKKPAIKPKLKAKPKVRSKALGTLAPKPKISPALRRRRALLRAAARRRALAAQAAKAKVKKKRQAQAQISLTSSRARRSYASEATAD